MAGIHPFLVLYCVYAAPADPCGILKGVPGKSVYFSIDNESEKITLSVTLGWT